MLIHFKGFTLQAKGYQDQYTGALKMAIEETKQISRSFECGSEMF